MINPATDEELEIPSKYVCPLTLEIMQDPVLSRYGQSYERSAIIKWLAKGNTGCPLTRQPLNLSGLITNHNLRSEIRRWQVANQEDVTVIVDGQEHSPGIFGIITLDKDGDYTDRTEDDSDSDDFRLEIRLVDDEMLQSSSTRNSDRRPHRGFSRNSRRHRSRSVETASRSAATLERLLRSYPNLDT